MTPELAIRLAQCEATEGEPMNVLMRRANAIFMANSTDIQKPFGGSDVAFATFVDYLRETGSQRERDLVLVSEALCRVWKTLHITVQAMGERPSPADEQELNTVAPALQRLGLLHLLTENLRADLCQWVTEAVDNASKSDIDLERKEA